MPLWARKQSFSTPLSAWWWPDTLSSNKALQFSDTAAHAPFCRWGGCCLLCQALHNNHGISCSAETQQSAITYHKTREAAEIPRSTVPLLLSRKREGSGESTKTCLHIHPFKELRQERSCLSTPDIQRHKKIQFKKGFDHLQLLLQLTWSNDFSSTAAEARAQVGLNKIVKSSLY